MTALKAVPGKAGKVTSDDLIAGTGNSFAVGMMVKTNATGGSVTLRDGSASGAVLLPDQTFKGDDANPIIYMFPVALHAPNGVFVVMGTAVESVTVFTE